PPAAGADELRVKNPGQSGIDRVMKTFSCKACGAKVSYDPSVKALACAYCGSSYVIEEEQAAFAERPNRIVPFAFDKTQAEQRFWKWLGKGFFRPRDLTKKSALNEIRGVYMPFWAFDADAYSNWSADAGYHYYEKEAYTEKDQQGHTVTKYRDVQKTRWQPASGAHSAHYEDFLVSASKGLDQEWVNKIAPFELTQAKSYNGDYLAGFAAENPSIDPAGGRGTAAVELQKKETAECARLVPGDTHRNLNVRSSFANWNYDLALLPLWISAFLYKDKVYRFLVNGQTGEVQGSAPFSWLKLILVLLIAAGVIGGATLVALLLGQQ
ncbi:MAG: zinc ribbon domain-containing protein, partial [Myxococcales bacterium]|nr:zinc ribbon domain-containing protein [Myxococcales bacterium]